MNLAPLPLARAEPADGPDLCAVFADTPMEGAVWLHQDRRPDFFHGAAVQCESPEVFVSRRRNGGGVDSVFAAGRRRVFVNGQPRRVRYLSDLRIASDRRGSAKLARGFQFLRREVLGENEYAQTLVLRENEKALNLLTSRRCGLPGYFSCGDYDYSLFSLRRPPARRSGLQVRRATLRDVPAMQAFFDREAPRKQFFPAYRFSDLDQSDYYRGAALEDFFLARAGEEIVGLLGTWDQGDYKKTVVRGYARKLRWARPWLNLGSRLRGGIELPAPGAWLRTLYLHGVVCRDNAPEILTDLLRAVRTEYAGQTHHHAALGLDRRDPLREALAESRPLSFAGRHFLVSFGDDPRPNLQRDLFYFEAARI